MVERAAHKGVIGLCLSACLTTGVHAAGGAYVVDDASIGSPSECQVETWIATASYGEFVGVTQPACVVKLGVPVEFTVTAQGVRLEGEWATLTGLQSKFVLLPMEGSNLGIALVINTLQDVTKGTNATFINVPVTVKVRDDFRLNVNSGWLHDTVDDTSHFTWGTGIEWDFRPQWTLLSEVYGQTGHLSDPRVQTGLRFAATKNVDLDIIYGHNISGENASWVTAGVTVRFP